jgi:hypothetical protein
MSPPRRGSASPDWRWRTFPVLAAFFAGLLIASLLNTETDHAVEAIVQIVAICGAAYVLIHLVVMNVIVAGRIKRRDAAIARGEEPEEQFEDVVVYPQPDAPSPAEGGRRKKEGRARRR